jgi:hypothetical protein
MKLTLGTEWKDSVDISKAQYHIEGLQTGIHMTELVDTIYFGIIVPLPTHERGFCSFRYKDGVTHSDFIGALNTDRESKTTMVTAPKYFTGLKSEFWNSTNAGKLIEPLSVIVPPNHTILFNKFLPHGISNARRNVSLYIDSFVTAEHAEARHNKWYAIQSRWESTGECYDINAEIRTESGSNKYPTKGYYDRDTYRFNWKIHKIWTLLMKSAPSHWPSGKETFAVHTSGYGTAKRKGLLEGFHPPDNPNLVRFHYRTDTNITLDGACQSRCIEKGFRVPDELIGEKVVRDPSLLDPEFAIRFGFESIV